MEGSRVRTFCLLLLVCGGVASAAPSAWRVEGVERIVAMSDVHGAYAAMVRTLQNAAVLDADDAWSGGAAHLVIAGDLLDRGPDSRAAMDLLMRLEGEAAAAGGRVHVLLGNHEAMNLMGDLRYVSPEEYAAFAPDETAPDREAAFAAWAAREAAGDEGAARVRFDTAYPPGYFAHRRAFVADGAYGRWLLTKPVIVVLDRTAFVHAGLSPLVTRDGLDGVNAMVGDLAGYVRARGDLERAGLLLPTDDIDVLMQAADRATAPAQPVDAALAVVAAFADSDLNAPDGPLWYRGNVHCGELVEEGRLGEALAAIGADRVVIGHTPTPNRQVLQRIDGRVVEVDTGMLASHYGGRGHALVIEGDSLRVVSEESAESLAVAEHPRDVGPRPAGLAAAADLERLLEKGKLGAVTEDAEGRSVVTVGDGETSVQAVFRPRASRDADPELAAYRLDRWLELDMVPVTVAREVDGKHGSLQYLPPGVVNEGQRTASGQGASAYCPLVDQVQAMYVFDTLIYNEGRTRDRILYDPDGWQLMLVGHDRAFAPRKGRPAYLAKAPMIVTDGWREALSALDEAALEKALGDALGKRQRQALLARRDELLDEAGQAGQGG
ncbi:MAG TPA: metallophosphoesterase [Woeseiaceae bacterium]|nr:metallophosphoesterase [Woeseiaceae bacterium]